ncbi:MAG: hypothetical protein H6Q41_106 [Deltaproteobacteria bacterium]|nr:hypothetical protein [Deltaproteobacteria bacterium]
MLTTDQKLDRRIILEARTLCRVGYHVTILAAPWPEGKESYWSEPFDLIRIGNSRTGYSGNQRGAISLTVYRLYHWLRKRGPLVHPYIPLIRSIFRAYLSDLESFYIRLFIEEAISARGDLYHVHDLQPLAPGFLSAERLGAKLVYDSHELFVEQEFLPGEKRKWRQIEKKYIHHADRVITVNSAIAAVLEKRYSITRPFVIMNCESKRQRLGALRAETSNLVRRLGLLSDARLLLYQGGLSPKRNLEILVHSIAYVRNPRVVLVILGSGELKGRLVELIKHFGLSRRVFLIPGVPQQDLLPITAQADLGIIPYAPTCLNTFYCTPNKLFEYIAAGVPVLVSDLPEVRKIVETHDLGWVADLTTPKKIAEAIDVALFDERVLKKRRENAARAFETLCWEEEEKKLIEVYEGL